MADSSVQITAGSGTNIDTHVPTGGDHRQVVVIGDPNTVGGVAPVDATYGLDVDVSRVIPGTGATNLGKAEDTAHVDGDVGVMILGVREHYSGSNTQGDYAAISVGPYGDMNTLSRKDVVRTTVTSAGLSTGATYAAGDQMGNLFTFNGVSRLSGGTGTIVGVTLIDSGDVLGAVDLVIFDSSVTLAADNAAFAISDTDALKTVCLIQLAGAIDIGNNRIAQAQNISFPYACVGGTSLYGALVSRSITSVNFTNATDIQIALYVERN